MHESEANRAVGQSATRPGQADALDWLMTGLAVWLVGGAYVDGWAHTHGRADTTFFTPWHAVLYSGFLAMASTLAVQVIRGVARRQPWQHALPHGYNLALLGAVVFWLGGVGDLFWHTWFGIEQDVEALLSPTHLMLAGGAWLMAGGPFRAAWHRGALPPQTLWQGLPCWLSLLCMLSVCTFILQVAHPISAPWGGGSRQSLPVLRHIAGVVSALWDTGLSLGFLLLAMRRWVLPPGSITLVLGLNAAAMGVLLPGAYPLGLVVLRVLAACLADVAYRTLHPTMQRPRAWRLFAVLLPLLLNTAHFAAMALGGGLWWSVHLWAGTIGLTGVVGLLLSVLVLPPALPAAPDASI